MDFHFDATTDGRPKLVSIMGEHIRERPTNLIERVVTADVTRRPDDEVTR